MTISAVWPQDQPLEEAGDPNIVITHFKDAAAFNKALSETILRLERSSSYAEHLVRGICGTKLHHIERWDSEEASTLSARACGLFCRVTGAKHAFVDASWGNIYRKNDYCIPHSHIRAQASIVYMVEEGDSDSKDPLSGKFCIVDPRIKYCNQHEQGRLTRVLMPQMRRGSMIIFPGSVVHSVNPYFGQRPRITMSWNINAQALAGNPRQTFEEML